MDISELKNEYGALSAPEGFNMSRHSQQDTSHNFIDRLMKSDKKSKEIIRRFYIIYFVIAAFYFALFILNPDQNLKLNDRINGTLLFIGIMLFAIMGKMKYTKLSKINYHQSTQSFLNEALNRYKFWTKEMNYAVLIVVLINVGSCRSYVFNYPYFEDTTMNILAFEIIFVSAMSIGIYVGYRHWRTYKKPIVDEINSLLKEES